MEYGDGFRGISLYHGELAEYGNMFIICSGHLADLQVRLQNVCPHMIIVRKSDVIEGEADDCSYCLFHTNLLDFE